MYTAARSTSRLGLRLAGSTAAAPNSTSVGAAPAARATHAVQNQATPFECAGYSLFDSDTVLQEAVAREAGDWATERLRLFGAACGEERATVLARQANGNPPKLHTHDRFGHRVDVIEFHPAYHDLMRMGVEAETPALAWNNAERPTAHAARAALPYMFNQVESGVNCPLTMTYAAVPALRHSPALAAEWLPKVTAALYDPADAPLGEKAGATIGMSMTEKQGGSDVRANTTVAAPLLPGREGDGEAYLLEGHKWFTSAPMCDGFLTLAYSRAEYGKLDSGGRGGSLSCFLVPRWRPDGARNEGFRVMRLKDKMGDKSNASSEVEYHGAYGTMVGREGRGVATIIDMVQHTRLDCMIGSSAQVRMALAQAVHHTDGRSAFGRPLAQQPLMGAVLADLALHSEACAALTFRMAAAFDQAHAGGDGALARIGTAVCKYWICKAAPKAVYEAMECHGGNGYVEDSIMPRLFRQSPLNAIWEGSGNVICLDVLRALHKEPASGAALLAEINLARGADARLDATVDKLGAALSTGTPAQLERGARQLVDTMATALAASLLLRHAPSEVADAFCSRLGSGADLGLGFGANHTSNFGTLPEGADVDAIVERARPKHVQA